MAKAKKHQSTKAKQQRLARVQELISANKRPYQRSKLLKEASELSRRLKIQESNRARWAPYHQAKLELKRLEALAPLVERARHGEDRVEFVEKWDTRMEVLRKMADTKTYRQLMKSSELMSALSNYINDPLKRPKHKAERPKKARGGHLVQAEKPERAQRGRRRGTKAKGPEKTLFDLKAERARIKKIKDPVERAAALEAYADQLERSLSEQETLTERFREKSRGLSGSSLGETIGKAYSGTRNTYGELMDKMEEDKGFFASLDFKKQYKLLSGEFVTSLWETKGVAGLKMLSGNQIFRELWQSNKFQDKPTELQKAISKMFEKKINKMANTKGKKASTRKTSGTKGSAKKAVTRKASSKKRKK